MKYDILSDFKYTPLLVNIIGYVDKSDMEKRGIIPSVFYSTQYILSGAGYYGSQRITKGQGFLIYPGQTIPYYADEKDPWEYVWTLSSDDSMKELFDRYNADPEMPIFEFQDIDRVKSVADDVVAKSKVTRRVDSMEMLEMFLRLFNHQFPMEEWRGEKEQSNSELYLEFCKNYIEDNINKKVTVDALATLLGVSQSYLHKIFSQRHGMSPTQYIIFRKLRKAKRLLLSTELAITQIADMVGYNDVLAFSRAFTSKEKLSPQKYREKMLKD